MNDFSTWMQGNWYALGNLLTQISFLLAGIWFARKILKTIRASQEQFGALLKLSLTDELRERATSGATHRPTPYVMAEWPLPAEAPALSLPETEPRRKRLKATWVSAMHWLQTPMDGHWLHSWRRVARWLQAPAGS
jgi:hypothetical protein